MGKYWCCCPFVLVLLVVNIYLFYAGWFLPIAINTHRLRYNQLVPFEVYDFSIDKWFEYHVEEEKIDIITYRQQKDYEYEYFLGNFRRSNYSIDHLEEILNMSISDNSSFVQLDWNNFVIYLNNDEILKDLYIMQYSQAHCENKEICFEEWYSDHNGSDHPAYYIYTPLQQQFIDIDSQVTSSVLDGTRDTFMFIIMLAVFIWLLLVIDFFEDPSLGMEGTNYLIITIFFIGVYYLWVFILSIVPISFSVPVYKTNDLYYYEEVQYSLAYTFGGYNSRWWVFGVLIQGFWCYILVLSIPFIACLYLLISCFCCCDEKRSDKYGGYIIIPISLILLVMVIMISICYFVLFLGNLAMYNSNTFTDVDNEFVIQAICALLAMCILVPILAILLWVATKFNKNEDDKPKQKTIHSIGRTMTKLPVVKNRVTSSKYQKHTQVSNHPVDRDDLEAVPMTQTNQKNKNIAKDNHDDDEDEDEDE